MAGDPFDLERLRRNFDRAIAPAPPPLPPRFAEVQAPLDPYPEARRLLERITALARQRFPDRQKSLAPFLAEAADLLHRMQAASAPSSEGASSAAGEGAPGTEAPPKEDVAALRGQLQEVLYDLEDLFEVYAGIGLP